jgi:hypothetical protein
MQNLAVNVHQRGFLPHHRNNEVPPGLDLGLVEYRDARLASLLLSGHEVAERLELALEIFGQLLEGFGVVDGVRHERCGVERRCLGHDSRLARDRFVGGRAVARHNGTMPLPLRAQRRG